MSLSQRLTKFLKATIPGRIRGPVEAVWRKRRQAHWEAVERARGVLTIGLEHGGRLRLYGDSQLCRLIYLSNFEAETRSFLEAFLRPGDIFVDVGANIGLFTVLGARLVGKTGEVHSFEPYPPTFARLQENVALNGLGNVRCNRMGLSNTKGEADMTVSTDGFDAWNSLGRPYMGTAMATKKVQVTTWDDYAH